MPFLVVVVLISLLYIFSLYVVGFARFNFSVNYQVNESNKIDENLIGTYLPGNLELVFNEVVEGLDDDVRNPPDCLIDHISQVIAKTVPPPERPPIRFDTM